MNHPREPLGAVLAVALVVLAGCGAATTVSPPGGTATGTPSSTAATPTATAGTQSPITPTEPPTPTGTPTPVPTSVPVDGSLPVDATAVWTRVRNITATDVSPPSVEVYDIAELRQRRRGGELPGYLRALGIRKPRNPVARFNRSIGGLTYRSGDVFIYLAANVSRETVECVVAHEFAHNAQFKSGLLSRIDEELRSLRANASGIDGLLVLRGLKEGAAVAVERAYGRRYGCDGLPYAQWFAEGTAYQGYVAGPYLFGLRYVRATGLPLDNLSALAADPPATTEQLLHPGREDPPMDLSVVQTTDRWDTVSRTRLGELVVRVALSANLSEQRAARAAAGWGNDELVRLRNGSGGGWVWALRWDNVTEADEFAAAFTAYLDTKGRRLDGGWVDDFGTHWRLVRTGGRTVAIVFGTREFVETVAVNGGETVAVTTQGNTTTRMPTAWSVGGR